MSYRQRILQALALVGLLLVYAPPAPRLVAELIVQADDLAAARHAVQQVGGVVTHELGIIHAVGARLDSSQLRRLEADSTLTLWANRVVEKADSVAYPYSSGDQDPSSATTPDTDYPSLVGAASLHNLGVTGRGVTVAVVDTGYFATDGIARNPDGSYRILANYDARTDSLTDPVKGLKKGLSDYNGHGSHVSSVILSSRVSATGLFNGVAPSADLVAVTALDDYGSGTYLDVIRGLDWLLNHGGDYGVRVVNLSLSAPAVSHYWEDPFNQAVMRLWQAGFVVVASAGNDGPDALSISVPGNNPYVITVGAMSDNYTPDVPGDDFLTSFSAAGPTFEGFVKPELVAPGGHILGLMWPQSEIAVSHPEYQLADDYFIMSGTSQATAVVSGVAALLLEMRPFLEPDQVKCLLLDTARAATSQEGALAYSVFQQGAGMVDAWAASQAEGSSCANQGLEIEHDLNGEKHFAGPANVDENGNFYVTGLDADGTVWDGTYVWSQGYLWSNLLSSSSYLWSNSDVYSGSYLWSNVGSTGYVFSTGLTERIATNRWVSQQ